MNRIQISGQMESSPDFQNGVGRFLLRCGASHEVIGVVASEVAEEQMKGFQAGDSISVDGRLVWTQNTLGILAAGIREHSMGVYGRAGTIRRAK